MLSVSSTCEGAPGLVHSPRPIAAARWGTMTWNVVAWAIFAAGYGGSVVFVAAGLHASAGAVLLEPLRAMLPQ